MPAEKESTVAGADLLSVLLDRGNKLRENMILSSLTNVAMGSKPPTNPLDFPTEIDLPDVDISGLSKR